MLLTHEGLDNGIEEEHIMINTQESSITMAELASQDEDLVMIQESDGLKPSQETTELEMGMKTGVSDSQQERRSERLRKDIHLTAQEKNENMAKKTLYGR